MHPLGVALRVEDGIAGKDRRGDGRVHDEGSVRVRDRRGSVVVVLTMMLGDLITMIMVVVGKADRLFMTALVFGHGVETALALLMTMLRDVRRCRSSCDIFSARWQEQAPGIGVS